MIKHLFILCSFKLYILLAFIGSCQQAPSGFDINQDLLLLHYDCKTDVDDLHSIAAAASLLRTKKYKRVKYHTVAGAYGIQEGLYVPGESLFRLAFGNRWSDAHKNYNQAIEEAYQQCNLVLQKGARVWIAEAGQSDFSADLIKKIIENYPKMDTKASITIVQHSEWNESVTDSVKLSFAKANANYIKIADGNAINNGTPGFNTKEKIDWLKGLESKENLQVWQLAFELANKYNGVENRYLNKTIAQNGIDFSDFSEVHYILGLEDINNASDYFEYLRQNP